MPVASNELSWFLDTNESHPMQMWAIQSLKENGNVLLHVGWLNRYGLDSILAYARRCGFECELIVKPDRGFGSVNKKGRPSTKYASDCTYVLQVINKL